MNITGRNEWGMIIKEPLQRQNLSRVDAIAVHHMAHPTADIKTVESWHLNQGWRAFGYSYWIGFDGKIYEGRGYDNIAAGVANQNDHIISIGFQGNFQSGIGLDVSVMSDAQFNSGVWLIKWIMQKVLSVKIIGGHKDFMATACPGNQFPLAEMQTLKERGAKKAMFKDISINDWGYNHIKKLQDYGIVNGDENGNFRPDDNIHTP